MTAAFSHLREGILSLKRESPDHKDLSIYYAHLGHCHVYAGSFRDAFNSFDEGIRQAASTGNELWLAWNTAFTGWALQYQSKWEDARKYLTKAKTFFQGRDPWSYGSLLVAGAGSGQHQFLSRLVGRRRFRLSRLAGPGNGLSQENGRLTLPWLFGEHRC